MLPKFQTSLFLIFTLLLLYPTNLLKAQCEGAKNFGESFFVDLYTDGSNASFDLDGEQIALTFNQGTGKMEINASGNITFHTNGSGDIQRLSASIDIGSLTTFEAGPVSIYDLANNNGAFGGGNAGYIGLKSGDKFGWLDLQLCGATTCGEYVFTIAEGGIKNTQRGTTITGNCNDLCEEPEIAVQVVNGLPFIGTIISGDYLAFQEVNSIGKVEAGDTVSFFAGEQIILSPGFHAKLGGDFLAAIEICSQPSGIIAEKQFPTEEQMLVLGNNQLPKIKTALEDGSYLKTYPNPVGTALTIRCKFMTDKNNSQEQTEVYLTDMLGRVLIHNTVDGSEIGATLDLSSIKSGMYQLVLQNGNQILSDRIVKII